MNELIHALTWGFGLTIGHAAAQVVLFAIELTFIVIGALLLVKLFNWLIHRR